MRATTVPTAATILFLSCCWLFAVDAPVAEAPKEVAKPAEAAELPPILLDVKPNQIHVSSSVSFDENGVARHNQSSCYMSLMVRPPTNRAILGCRYLRTTKVLLNTGQSLEPRDQGSQMQHFVNRRQDPGQMFQFNVQLSCPPATATTITRLEGVITLLEPEGPEKTATLPPIKDIEGKNIRVEGVGDSGAWMMVRRSMDGTNPMLTIEMLQSSWLQCTSVKLVSANDNVLTNQDMPYGDTNDKFTRVMRVKAPDDSRLVMTFVPKVRTSEVLFALQNLPLPTSSPVAPTEIRVKAVDRAEQAAIAVQPVEGANQLKVSTE